MKTFGRVVAVSRVLFVLGGAIWVGAIIYPWLTGGKINLLELLLPVVLVVGGLAALKVVSRSN